MTNHILGVSLRDHKLIAAEADVRVVIQLAHVNEQTQIRGRILGPRCLFAECIEVAYPLRSIPTGDASADTIVSRVIIPEASFWDPTSPYLYVAIVELSQDGVRVEEVRLRHGLRDVRVGPHGLRVNGRPLQLRGKMVETLTEAQALDLRQSGYNLLVVPADVESKTAAIWEIADRVGFFVIGEPEQYGDAFVADLAGHPSDLGWLDDDSYTLGGGNDSRPLHHAGCPEPIGVVER